MKKELYPLFLDAGYSPDLFWGLGIDEVVDLLESYLRKMRQTQEKRNSDLRDAVILLWNQNQQLLNLAGCCFTKGTDSIPLEQYYPGLFDERAEQAEQEKIQNQIALHKARMEEYAFRHNRALKERG